MVMPSTLFCFLLTVILVSGLIVPDEPKKGTRILTRNRHQRSVPNSMKVLDFSADNDMEKDSKGEYTSATLNAGALPESFTICMAIFVDAWTTEFKGAKLFILLDVNGEQWGYVRIFAASSYTEYMVYLGPFDPHVKQIETIFFPLQWTRACRH